MKQNAGIVAFVMLLGSTVIPVFAAESTPAGNYQAAGSALIILICITLLALVVSICLTVAGSRQRKRSARQTMRILTFLAYGVTLVALVVSIFFGVQYRNLGNTLQTQPTETESQPTQGTTPSTEVTEPSTEPTEIETQPPTEPEPTLHVGNCEDSDPKNWGVSWEILSGGSVVDSFERSESIFFTNPNKESYFAFPGIATFRGDNYRTGAAYGTVNVVNKTLTHTWEREISSMPKGVSSGSWTGAGWTGQPLVVQWDEATRENMNLYENKKTKDGLVEVIYATLDGHIYFYDLEDGSYTRDPLHVGMAFKGSGSLDPRGYPILYVGSGDRTQDWMMPRMFVISLIDCSILYEHGHNEENAYRTWRAFDSAPLVHGESDTLIWPGENGLLYTIKMNTRYDPAAGSLSMSPDAPVCARYNNTIGYTKGYESSAVIVEHYAYIADNGGMLFCMDLNTMELVWAQNVHDDTNATPVFRWGEDGEGYLYTATSMENGGGKVYIQCFNASTGKCVWENIYEDVYYDYSVSGGVLSSPILGKEGTQLEGMILYHIARTPGAYNGILLALDVETGETIWEKQMNNYTWSSPVAVYGNDGTAHIVICDSGGNARLLDPLTGETLDTVSIGSNAEASPVVFNDMLVIGTRGQRVIGIKIG